MFRSTMPQRISPVMTPAILLPLALCMASVAWLRVKLKSRFSHALSLMASVAVWWWKMVLSPWIGLQKWFQVLHSTTISTTWKRRWKMCAPMKRQPHISTRLLKKTRPTPSVLGHSTIIWCVSHLIFHNLRKNWRMCQHRIWNWSEWKMPLTMWRRKP